MSWVVGSVVDIRLPAVNMAQEIAKVEPGTEEGEVISMLGVSVSVFVSVEYSVSGQKYFCRSSYFSDRCPFLRRI